MAPTSVPGASPAPDQPFPMVPPPGLVDHWYDLRERVRNSPALALAVAGCVLALGAAGWWLLRPPPAPLETALPRARTAAVVDSGGSAGAGGAAVSTLSGPAGSVGTSGVVGTSGALGASGPSGAPAPDLVVQAAGAVEHPGVYRVAAGGRVDDLVRRAGGLTADADGDRINLAAPISDGERVWLPRRGEGDPPAVVAGTGGGSGGGGVALGGGGSGSGAVATPPSPVDLNTATAEQLDTLPGVGPATAAAIIAYRTQHGRFSAVEDLLDVRGIGDAKLEQLRPLARV